MKTCTKCGVEKPLTEFNKNSASRDGHRPDCRTCHRARVAGYESGRRDKRAEYNTAYYGANADDIKASRKRARLSRFGLTDESFAALLDSQGGACAICRSPEPGGIGRWHVDHDHECCKGDRSCGTCVRGLLCMRCNAALGLFRDNPAFLASAITYLEGARSVRPHQPPRPELRPERRDRLHADVLPDEG